MSYFFRMENIIQLFVHNITLGTRPEYGFLKRFIDVHSGNVSAELRQHNLVECFRLAHTRWSLLLKEGLGIEMNANLQNNLTLVAMLGGPKFDSMPTFAEQIRMVSGITDYGDQTERVHTVQPRPMYKLKELTQLINPKELAKFERLSIALARFVSNNDIYFLTSLVLLLKDDETHLSWHQSLKRLLFKRLNDYCGHTDGIQDANKIFDEFVTDFNDYVMVQRKVTRIVQEHLSPTRLVAAN